MALSAVKTRSFPPPYTHRAKHAKFRCPCLPHSTRRQRPCSRSDQRPRLQLDMGMGTALHLPLNGLYDELTVNT